MNDIINDLNKLYELNAISFELRNSSFQEFQKIISRNGRHDGRVGRPPMDGKIEKWGQVCS